MLLLMLLLLLSIGWAVVAMHATNIRLAASSPVSRSHLSLLLLLLLRCDWAACNLNPREWERWGL